MRKLCAFGILALMFFGTLAVIAQDATIAAKIQRPTPDKLTVASGGTLEILSGATFTNAATTTLSGTHTFSGNVTFTGSTTTIDTSDTLAVTTADKLTVGGRIVPTEIQATYTMLANGSLADQTFFVATRAYEVVACSFVGSVAGSDGGTVALQVTKDTSTDAPGAGTDLLTAAFDLKATANTVQAGTLVASATLSLAAGDRLAVDFAGTLTGVAGVTVTCTLKPDA